MQATISGHQFDLTPAIKKFVLENLRDTIERIWDKNGSVLEVHLSDLRGPKGGVDQECRAILQMPDGPKLVITEVTTDMRTSIHQVRKRLLRRVRKHLSQRTDLARRPRKQYIAKVVPKDLITRMPKARDVPNAHEVSR